MGGIIFPEIKRFNTKGKDFDINRLHNILLYLILAILIPNACSTPQAQSNLIQPSSTPKPVIPIEQSLQPADTPFAPTLPPPFPSSEPSFSILEGRADVGGAHIHYICFGEGSPTVILDSGFAMNWSNWRSVMQEVAPQTRICAYDRLGLGGSDPPLVSRPRTSLDMATELDNFLVNADLAGPYILAGHSAGGFNVLVYANQHPQAVVGMVLVDPCNPDIFQQMLDSLPPEYAGESSEVADCRHVHKDAIEFFNLPNNKEGWDLVMSFEQVRMIKSLADLPLIVITDLHDTMCQGELGEKEDQIWTNLHADYAALSTNGSQVITNFGISFQSKTQRSS